MLKEYIISFGYDEDKIDREILIQYVNVGMSIYVRQ